MAEGIHGTVTSRERVPPFTFIRLLVKRDIDRIMADSVPMSGPSPEMMPE